MSIAFLTSALTDFGMADCGCPPARAAQLRRGKGLGPRARRALNALVGDGAGTDARDADNVLDFVKLEDDPQALDADAPSVWNIFERGSVWALVP